MPENLESSSKPLMANGKYDYLSPSCSGAGENTTGLADPSKAPVVAVLNDHWRVVDDPLQWILQVRKGRKTKKGTGWRGRSYCTQRTSLLRCISEYCGEVDPETLEIIEAFPKSRIDRDRKRWGGSLRWLSESEEAALTPRAEAPGTQVL